MKENQWKMKGNLSKPKKQKNWKEIQQKIRARFGCAWQVVSKMTFFHVLPYKGVTQGPVGSKCLLNDLKDLGYPKMVMRYDFEPALNSVGEAAKNGFEKELILEKNTKRNSESTGEIKRAVQTIQFQNRTQECTRDKL